MTTPHFSVIVPVKDDPVGLERALASVAAQTLAAHELIVVDDGSSVPVSVPTGVLLVRHENARGPAAARNAGAAHATGDYLAFCDSDDVFGVDRLIRAAMAHESGADVAVCQQSSTRRDIESLRRVTTFTPHLGAITIARSSWKPIDERYRACEDVEWWIRVARLLPIAIINVHDYHFIGTDHPRELHSHEARLAYSYFLLDDHADFFAAHSDALAFRLRRIARMEAAEGNIAAAASIHCDAARHGAYAGARGLLSRGRDLNDAVTEVKRALRWRLRPKSLPPLPRQQARSWAPLRSASPDSAITYASASLTALTTITSALPRGLRGRLLRLATLGKQEVHARSRWGRIVLGRQDTCWLAPTFDEPLETAILARLLSPGDVFVDIGAHRGWYSLLGAARVGPKGRVVAVEPDARMQHLLARTVAVNDANNLTVVPVAIGERDGEVPLVRGPESALSRTDHSGQSSGSVSVPLMTLSSLALRSDLKRIDAMKIDVEGAEVGVLHSLKAWLHEGRPAPIVLLEVEPEHLRRFGNSVEDLVSAIPASLCPVAIDAQAGGLVPKQWRGEPFAGRKVLLIPWSRLDAVFGVVHRETWPSTSAS